MSTTKYPLAVMVTFLWVGFVCAISFLEAWLKFSAPGVTVAIGLGIGRLVFSALNKIEWVLCLAIAINFFPLRRSFFGVNNILYLLPVLLLVLQTFWLLPALDARAELYIGNQPMLPSNRHFYYVALEIIKVICLCLFGVSLFKGSAVANSVH